MSCKVTNRDIHGNEVNIDRMLKKFKKLVEKEEVIYECRRREFFVSKRLRKVEKQKKNQRLKRKLAKGN